jgi:hypothetical protein
VTQLKAVFEQAKFTAKMPQIMPWYYLIAKARFIAKMSAILP